MIDLHSHILPGIDDGARSLEESVEIAAAAVEEGIDVLAATPHVRDDYPTDAETMQRKLAEVSEALRRAGIPLDLRPGGELALERVEALGDEELRAFGLGGNPRYLLVEFPYYGWPLDLAEKLFVLRARGFTPVLAHPERNREVQESPARLEPLVATGALVQLTASSVTGRLGRSTRRTANRLIELELAHLVSSDAHSLDLRGIGMADAARELGPELAEWMLDDVPAAIAHGGPLPERPERRRRGLFSRKTWNPNGSGRGRMGSMRRSRGRQFGGGAR